VLQDLVTSHISLGILDDKRQKLPGLCEDLKSIPIWPSYRCDTAKQTLCSNTAFIASNDKLLVPWMKEGHRFVDPLFLKNSSNRTCLQKLGINVLSVDVLLERHILPLPSILNETDWKQFINLTNTLYSIWSLSRWEISSTVLFLLKQSTIAANGNRTLMKASKLYDREEEIFAQAFRNETKIRFLHDEVVAWRPFWHEVGLRRRDDIFITATDYLECLQAIGRRLHDKDFGPDPYLEQDCITVLSPLTAFNSTTQRFTADDWKAVSQQRVFLSRAVFNAEPEFRKSCMAAVASKHHRLLCISEIISYDYVAVCWSQTPFPIHQPATEVLNRVSGKGQPKVSMVWQHLQHMSDTCKSLKQDQVRDFLADLSLTYNYLQDRLEDSSTTFISQLQKMKIWLNLDSLNHRYIVLADIKSSWYGINSLVLSSSCDAESIKAVRPGLMRYEKLLKALGCAFIVYPTVERPPLYQEYSLPRSLQQLRSESKMLDITYSSEGKSVKAHRLILAAASAKCAAQFSGAWKVEDVIEYDKVVDSDNFLSYHALSTMIEYAYGNEIEWEEMEVSEHDSADEKGVKLDKLLDLLKGSDCWLMPELKSHVQDKILLAGNAFMTTTNIVEIWERISGLGASGVEEMCAKFVEENCKVLKEIHGDEEIMAILLDTFD